MSIAITIVNTRLNTNTSFYYVAEETKQLIQTNYIDTGKLISNVVVSEDGLTRTTTQQFNNLASYLDFLSVVRSENTQRTTYSIENNITTITTIRNVSN